MGRETHMSSQSVIWELRNWGLGKISESGDKNKWKFPKQKGEISFRREIVWSRMENKRWSVREAARNCGYIRLVIKMRLWVCRGLAVKGGSEADLAFGDKPRTIGKHGRAGLGFVRTCGSGWPGNASSLEEGDRPCPLPGSAGSSPSFSLAQTFAGQVAVWSGSL